MKVLLKVFLLLNVLQPINHYMMRKTFLGGYKCADISSDKEEITKFEEESPFIKAWIETPCLNKTYTKVIATYEESMKQPTMSAKKDEERKAFLKEQDDKNHYGSFYDL